MTDDSVLSGDPKVSVILPTYNRASTVNRTIESVLNQTFADFELIIVDDASTDNTEAAVSAYDDDRVKYVRHNKNQGGSAARNTGIDRASGEYLFFTDSDDVWQPTKIERQIDCLASRSDEWIAVYCLSDKELSLGQQVRSILRSLLPIAPPTTEGKEGDDEIVRDILMMEFQPGGASTLGVKRTVIERIGGFDETFERHQDWEFLIRVLKHGKLACVEEPLVVKYDSGAPSADVYAQAKHKYFEKFQAEIEAHEERGDDVTTVHKLSLAKRYLREGRLKSGRECAPFSEMDLFQYLSFLWALGDGVIKKTKPTDDG